MKVKRILISQPEPPENSPYHQIAERFKVKIDFKPFIQVVGMTAKELRNQKIELPQHTAIILTSRNAVDFFFKYCEEMRYKVPDTMKYFCQSEAVAYYLQKYITYRKRKIYVGKKEFSDLIPIIKKHKEENFLIPSADVLTLDIESALNNLKIVWKRAILFKITKADFKGIKILKYDILAFFSPAGIESLFENFPNFKQASIRIATFGAQTFKAAQDAGLEVAIEAPTKESPSMTMALEKYLEKSNLKK